MDYYALTPVTILLRIFECFSQVVLISSILRKNINRRSFWINIVLFVISYEICSICIPRDIRGIISAMISIIIVGCVLKVKFVQALIAYAISGSISATIDCIISLSIVKICNLSSFNDIMVNNNLYALDCCIIYSVLLIISKVITLVNINNKKGYISDIINSTSSINFVVTFILLLPNLVMILYYYDGKELPLYMIIINICAIIAMFFVSTYNTKKGFELVTAEQELLTQRTYNKTLQNLVDGLRTFKHDYNNTLQTLYGYIQLENMSGLKKFFEQILDESRAITALDKLNPELFKNPSLFGIITAKFEYAKQNNVNINFEMYGKLEEADMQIYDLTRILGIFFDNAIEASTGSEKKKVNFMVYDRKDLITIEISNTYSEVGLKVEDLNKKGVSSKGENRGLGLYKVEEILKKYPSVKHETSAQNGMFRQKLVINKIKVKV